jgi:3-polyprenyl-4-hydroxybenzoate decarboxylase
MHLAGTVLSVGDRVKTAIVIDDDLDPYDPDAVFFSLATRMDARRDVVIIPLSRSTNDPSSQDDQVGGLLIDLTGPRENPEFEIGRPPREVIERAAQMLPPDVLRRVPGGSPFGLG